MTEEQKQDQSDLDDESQNPAVRAVESNQNPQMTLEKGRNAAEGKSPNAAAGSSSSTAEDHIPSNSDPDASDLPSAQ